MVFTSPPEQKWPPAPVRITTRAVGSASISSSTPSSSRRIVRSSALRASGRFSVIVAMACARSTSRVWYPTVRSFRECFVSRRTVDHGRPAVVDAATIADGPASHKSAPRGVEALHHAPVVGSRRLLEAAARVARDDPAPERLRLDVAPDLRDLPLARNRVEQPPRALRTTLQTDATAN